MMLYVKSQGVFWLCLQLHMVKAFKWHYYAPSFVSIYSFTSNNKILVIICVKACILFWWAEHIKYLSCVFILQQLSIWKNWKLLF